MSNEDGTVWAAFNGEIYNHRDIRRHLESRGHHFRGQADTEVLPHLYEDEGPALGNELRGMFAFAIYDTRTRTLLLCRDRYGIKPLFFALSPRRLAFASELRALLELRDIDSRPDRQAVYDFAALSYIPAPLTLYRGIRALEPGCWLEARLDVDGSISTKSGRFHTWSLAVEPRTDRQDVVEETESLLRQAVNRQMESDVPLGSLLSGGIDSSLVSCAAQASRSGGLRTFNVRFSDGEYDETWAATRVRKPSRNARHR
jgi:asparagine synthase (glutamine-hydrolysing)